MRRAALLGLVAAAVTSGAAQAQAPAPPHAWTLSYDWAQANRDGFVGWTGLEESGTDGVRPAASSVYYDPRAGTLPPRGRGLAIQTKRAGVYSPDGQTTTQPPGPSGGQPPGVPLGRFQLTAPGTTRLTGAQFTGVRLFGPASDQQAVRLAIYPQANGEPSAVRDFGLSAPLTPPTPAASYDVTTSAPVSGATAQFWLFTACAPQPPTGPPSSFECPRVTSPGASADAVDRVRLTLEDVETPGVFPAFGNGDRWQRGRSFSGTVTGRDPGSGMVRIAVTRAYPGRAPQTVGTVPATCRRDHDTPVPGGAGPAAVCPEELTSPRREETLSTANGVYTFSYTGTDDSGQAATAPVRRGLDTKAPTIRAYTRLPNRGGFDDSAKPTVRRDIGFETGFRAIYATDPLDPGQAVGLGSGVQTVRALYSRGSRPGPVSRAALFAQAGADRPPACAALAASTAPCVGPSLSVTDPWEVFLGKGSPLAGADGTVPQGKGTVRFEAVDRAGNAGYSQPVSFFLDSVAPRLDGAPKATVTARGLLLRLPAAKDPGKSDASGVIGYEVQLLDRGQVVGEIRDVRGTGEKREERLVRSRTVRRPAGQRGLERADQIRIRAVDRAGNVSSERTADLRRSGAGPGQRPRVRPLPPDQRVEFGFSIPSGEQLTAPSPNPTAERFDEIRSRYGMRSARFIASIDLLQRYDAYPTSCATAADRDGEYTRDYCSFKAFLDAAKTKNLKPYVTLGPRAGYRQAACRTYRRTKFGTGLPLHDQTPPPALTGERAAAAGVRDGGPNPEAECELPTPRLFAQYMERWFACYGPPNADTPNARCPTSLPRGEMELVTEWAPFNEPNIGVDRQSLEEPGEATIPPALAAAYWRATQVAAESKCRSCTIVGGEFAETSPQAGYIIQYVLELARRTVATGTPDPQLVRPSVLSYHDYGDLKPIENSRPFRRLRSFTRQLQQARTSLVEDGVAVPADRTKVDVWITETGVLLHDGNLSTFLSGKAHAQRSAATRFRAFSGAAEGPIRLRRAYYYLLRAEGKRAFDSAPLDNRGEPRGGVLRSPRATIVAVRRQSVQLHPRPGPSGPCAAT